MITLYRGITEKKDMIYDSSNKIQLNKMFKKKNLGLKRKWNVEKKKKNFEYHVPFLFLLLSNQNNLYILHIFPYRKTQEKERRKNHTIFTNSFSFSLAFAIEKLGHAIIIC